MALLQCVAFLGREAIDFAPWLWANRQHFAPAIDKVTDFVGSVMSNPAGAIRRVGSTLVFGTETGSETILAYIDQTAPKIDAIEHAVQGLQQGQDTLAAGMVSLRAGQQSLAAGLSSLQSISMVTLGLTALVPVILAVQFKALRNELDKLELKIEDLRKKIDAMNVAKLQTGIEFLGLGKDFIAKNDRVSARDRLNAALNLCVESGNYYAELLGNELNSRKVQRDVVRLLSRHLSVAIGGATGCHVALEQDEHALRQIQNEMPVLQNATKWVFDETVAKDPSRFLVPAMREYHVTLDLLTELYQQAQHAGAVDTKKRYSAGALFEECRDSVSKAWPTIPWRKSKYVSMREELVDAVASVEETNRIKGLETVIKKTHEAGKKTTEVMRELEEFKARANRDEKASSYVLWAL